jgi:hypothetical protein
MDGRSIVQIDPATLKEEEIDTLETIWDRSGFEKIRMFKWVFDLIVKACESTSPSSISATSFESVVKATDAVGVDYYEWSLKEDAAVSEGRLSKWAGRISLVIAF